MTTNEDLIEKIAYTRAFLEDASAAGLLPPHVRVHLITHLDARAQLVEPHASEPWPEPPVGPTTSVPPQPAGTGTRRTFATSAPSRVRPVPARRFDTDAAVRGLAALGVFLLIAATLGFVLFAFAGVHSGLRPVAELLIPVLLAGASRLLRGRLSPVAADGLAFAAGAVVPVVAFAAFVDGAPLPPDLAGRALAATWTIAAVALAAAYAAWARIRPATPLRFLVAPLGWLAVATGAATAEGRFSARAMLLAAVAVAVTAAAVRLAPSLGAAQAAAPGVWPASLAVFAAALAALARDGWPPVPAFGTGAAVVVALGLARAPDPRAGALLLSQVAVALGTAAALLPALGIGWGAAALVLLLLVILESPATSSTTTLGEATGLLVVLLLLATAADLDALTVAGAATGAWGHLRALTARSTRASDRAAWVGPLLALFAATVATSPTAAVFGGVAVIVGLTVATTALRLRGEGLYTWWLPVASAVVAVPAAAAPGVDAAVRSGALALLAAVVGTAPALASGPRVWAAAVPALASWHFLLAAATIELPTALALWALAGAVLAAVGILRSHRAPASARQLLLIGHLVLLGCLVAAGRTDAVPLPLLVLWTAGWATTLASPRAGRGAVVWALAATTPLLVAPLDVAGSDGRLLAALVALSALGVGLQRERPEWTTAGVALLLVTIAPSGADGLTGALALVALTCLAGGVRAGRGRARAVLLVVSALASVASWASLLVAVGASSEAATVGTALVAGAVLAAAGLAVRGGAPGDAALVWGSAWAVVLGVVAGATAANVPRDGWGPLALALALAAVGAASAAAPLRSVPLRYVASLLGVLATLAAARALLLGAAAFLVVATLVAVTTTLGALLLASLRAGSRWPAPLTAGGYAATAVAAVMAVPDAGQVGAVLFLAAVQSTALGLARNRAGVLATAPPLAAAGWGLLALDAVGGGALWYTVPVGAALLAEAEIGRWAVRQAGQPPATSGTLPLEWLGFVVLGAPLLVRTAADPPAALLATLVGAALVWWGAATRVRRRLWAGGAIGGAAPTLLLVVPLVRVLPAVRGPGLWLGLALVGVLLVGAAAALEPLRAVAAGTRERVSGRFEGWE